VKRTSARRRSFFVSASGRLRGGGVRQTVSLASVDFIAADGTALDGWRDVYVLSLRVYAEPGGRLVGSKAWVGAQPVFPRVTWDR